MRMFVLTAEATNTEHLRDVLNALAWGRPLSRKFMYVPSVADTKAPKGKDA